MRKIVPKFNELLCKRCGLCAAFCPHGVIGITREGMPVIRNDLCNACRLCVMRCPDFAVELEGVASG